MKHISQKGLAIVSAVVTGAGFLLSLASAKLSEIKQNSIIADKVKEAIETMKKD